MDVKTDQAYGTLLWGLWDGTPVMTLELKNGSLAFHHGGKTDYNLKVKVRIKVIYSQI